MKILVASMNFAPDHAGIAIYSTDFSVYLAEKGHLVSMVTGFPFYPHWKKRQEDEYRCFKRETYKGVEVYRGYVYVPSRVTTLRRLWHEFSFCFFAFINFFRSGRPDVIVLFTPPFFLGVVGVVAKWIWRRPLVINIQDLPLDAAIALGMMKRGFAAQIMLALEGWIYRNADLVVTISSVMLDNVRAKGVSDDRLYLVPNWIDVSEASKVADKGQFLSQHPQAQGKFTLAYAGNLGIKQGVDSLIYFARDVAHIDGVHVFVIGDGADKSRIIALANDLKLKNVTFLPFLSPDEYQLMLADVNVIFVAQRSGAGNNFFPSKLLGLMAQGKPLLVAADTDSELACVLTETGCGLVSSYGDTEKLVVNFMHLLENRGALAEMGAKGRQAVMAFDRNKVLSPWLGRMVALCKKYNCI
jgi:colanic acid biosynthesis glycosyl transferase WcaI